jgi:hypothetical protein
MKNLIIVFVAMLLLSSCDDNLKVISRDFDVTLKSVEGNIAETGKAVKCIFTVHNLDRDNDDQLFNTFTIKDGNGVIVVDRNEYSPGEIFEYDYKTEGNKLSFDYIPDVAGTQVLVMTLASEIISRSDSIVLKVKQGEN